MAWQLKIYGVLIREPTPSFQTPRGSEKLWGKTPMRNLSLQYLISLPRNLPLRKNQACVDGTSAQ